MNIFNKYGIREVADVVLYSITRVGTEEFYLPVLYLDTLKVSALEKSVTATPAYGGKGNSKIFSWNYDKEIKLKLEDALFSNTSLDMAMNGVVAQKMSNWTSAIAKLTVANKYGRKNYSIKAYPSPEITDDEWEIIYRCTEKAGFDPRTGNIWSANEKIGTNRLDSTNHTMKFTYSENDEDNTMVAENRWLLKSNYYRRTQKTPHSRDLSPFFDINEEKYESVSIVLKERDGSNGYLTEKELADKYAKNLTIESSNYVVITYVLKEDPTKEVHVIEDPNLYLHYVIEKRVTGPFATQCFITTGNAAADSELVLLLSDLFTGYNKEDTTTVPTYEVGDDFLLTHLPYFIFPNYLEDAIGDLCWCDMRDKIDLAMPQEVIDYIAEEITDFTHTGRIVNDLYEIQTIDRFERCVVKDRQGLKIDLQEQMKNIKKMYADEKSPWTVFYDIKTMLPFMDARILNDKITKQKCVRVYSEKAPKTIECFEAIKSYLTLQYPKDWIDDLELKDIVINKITQRDSESNYHYVYFNVLKREYITLKYGTLYLKRNRTIDEDNNDITFLGTELSIDNDTFSGEYMIVGETVIKNQKTGKDEQFQFIINRATLSAQQKLNLQAKGEPSTFTLDVAVLKPYDKKSMIELRMFKTEEDKVEGGTRIVPQDKHHVQTPWLQVKEQIVVDNNEIY